MYAIRNRNDPRIYFHYPESGGRKQLTQIDEFKPGKLPRLFEQEHFAHSALNNWLAGKLVAFPIDREKMSFKLVRAPDRKREDWEIIEVALVPLNGKVR